ncbi:MAG: ABC transporter substrate-binding protein [Clostridiales bacterium]|jgi:ABC-type nitrate/sulfonate/bicarbonate transport system substrate-binding protein|nr:ABC transporter substrate-binding protein [Clostridiales bacterium]
MKKLLFVLFIIAMFLTLPGCGSQNKNEGEITVVLDWTPNTNHAGLYVAQALGYYEELGLKVEIIQPPEDGALPLLAAGRADFGISFQESMIPAIAAQSLPVTAVAAILQHNTSGIISLKAKNIISPRDLEGKSYATWGLPIEQAIIKEMMTREKADFSQLQLIPNTVSDVIAALQTDIDCVWVYYGWDGVATEVAGLDTNYFAFAAIDPVFDFYTPVLAANNDFLKRYPEIAKKFLTATAGGYEYCIDDPQEGARILSEAVPELAGDLLNASMDYLAGHYKAEAPYWGFIDPARWDPFNDWLLENDLLEGSVELGVGYSNAYLPGAGQ